MQWWFISEPPWYVAECRETGVATQGKTLGEAIANLEEAVELYREEFTASENN